VNDACTFGAVATVEGICDRLSPSPSNDKCEQAEAQFMSLLLNVCRGRVPDGETIKSQCTTNTTVGQSRAQADALLCSSRRDQASCTLAQCESEEINSGKALGVTSLRLQKLVSGGVKLTWSPPYSSPDFEAARRYRVWRRPTSESVFLQIGYTSDLSFTDEPDSASSCQYEVTAVW